MSNQSPLSSMQPQAEPPGKRPWLPKRHVIGLALVLVFIVGSLGAGWVGLSKLDWEKLAEDPLAKDERGYVGQVASDMTTAMLRGEREEFVKWGEGAVAEQLGQMWDESSKLGWVAGYVSEVASEEDENARQLRRLEKDDEHHYASGLAISFDLGVSQQRIAGGDESQCGVDPFRCGMLTHAFEYDLEMTDGGDGFELDRISRLTPRKLMPWDTADGVHAVQQENTVVFGYGSEAARIDEVAGEVQRAAVAVLDTPIATAPDSHFEGFPVFVTDDPKRFNDASYGPDHQDPFGKDFVPQGLTLSARMPGTFNINSELEDEFQMLANSGSPGMALVTLNGSTVDDFFRVSAHEFAHAFDVGTYTHMFATDGADSAHSFGQEGFATFVEGVVVQRDGGQPRSTSPEVRALIAATPEDELGKLVDPEAFLRGETVGTAYAVAGNYFAFMAAGGADMFEVVELAEYLQYNPDVWVEMNFPKTTSGGTMDARYAAWRAWNAS